MGEKDTKAKAFLADNERFADLFNYYLFNGKQVIKAADLCERDTTKVLSVFGADKKEIQKQKWRDLLKSVIIKTTEYGIFVLLGVENQSEIHYAMPVRNMIYDAMEYSSQVNEATRLHKKEKDYKDSAEFLSGFKKEDKLTPVITLTVYWGAEEWDAPRSLYDMIDDKYNVFMKYMDNYHLHLIIPNEIEDFDKFQTSLGAVLEFIKASRSEEMMDKVVHNNSMFTQLDNEAVSTINTFTGVQIPVEKKEGKMDMCKAWEDHRMSGVLEGKREGIKEGKKEGKIEGKIEGKEIVNRLILCLIKDGRQEDIEKAVSDSAYQEELIQYYGLDREEEKLEV
ncbi:MAG: Rpn family recombination-promoting nuclease/putative transposase [Lachnospiraceae bacterium]|nr:Rpn family recombination-promoting nuclease/putative transposase [Lachnospiraceae bacterium]